MMEFHIPINIQPLPELIGYKDKILLTGSCFTEHIGDRLEELKFTALQNPNGILFDPYSVADSLVSYMQNRQYNRDDLFYMNELWQSWHHHSRFSNMDPDECLWAINNSRQKAHEFLKEADWIIITLGSAFSYHLIPGSSSHREEKAVANCHRAPAQWFNKKLLEIAEITTMLTNCCEQLWQFNPKLKFIFTVSPVRHIRDGVVDNNRSKARLIETVHQLAAKFDRVHYFPAYELVIDVLRDYRFYDIDLVHPNYMATEYVMEKFGETCIDKESQGLMQEIRKIVIARKHKAFQPDTNAHRQFLIAHFEKTKALQEKYPFLELEEELKYFQQ
jgi:GSCFA family